MTGRLSAGVVSRGPLRLADPAELVTTSRACHVIAPLILLDVHIALWARSSKAADELVYIFAIFH